MRDDGNAAECERHLAALAIEFWGSDTIPAWARFLPAEKAEEVKM